MKTIVLDIETRPNLVYVWQTYQADALDVVEPWSILSFSAKELGAKKATTIALPDVGGSEAKLLSELWAQFDQADIVIGHNLDAFDVRRSNTRFLAHGLQPPSPYQTVDTYKVAVNKFAFHSNKLKDLCIFMGVRRKVETGGLKLWLDCMKDVKKLTPAWQTMKKYNEGDVLANEDVYYKQLPWMSNHPNLAMLLGDSGACPRCGAKETMKPNGFRYNKTTKYKRYVCSECGGSARGNKTEKIVKPEYIPI